MSLRARVAAPDDASEEHQETRLVAVFRAKLLEEIEPPDIAKYEKRRK